MDQEELNGGLLGAAGRGDTKSVEDWVARGADVNWNGGWDGVSPLHWASWYGHPETVSRLVELGGNVNVKDWYGDSPLHEASRHGRTETVSRLVELGGDVNVKNDRGRTPYDMAENEVIKKLLKASRNKSNIGLPVELYQMDKESASMFTDLLKEDSYELFELRSMLQGEQGTGKSTIARFLVGKGPTKVRMSTDGIELYTGLSFFDDETHEWIDGKQGFAMEDITVSRSIKAFNKEGSLLQQLPEETNKGIAEQKNKEYMLPDDISETKCEHQSAASLSTDETEKYAQNTDDIMLKKHELQHSLTDQHGEQLGNKINVTKAEQATNPNDPVFSETIKNPGLIGKIKKFFGVKKQVNEIQISVTKTQFFKKSREIAKKQFHQRKIVPVTIWDFGGQDVFYSTHQTFLTYRAVYMLILDGSRTLNEPCKYEQFLPGRDKAKTQKDYVRFWINTIITYCKGEVAGFPKIMIILTHKDKLKVTEIDIRRNEIFGEIEEMFDGSLIKQHLVIGYRIFVNARNRNDPEMEQIKTSLICLARAQPTWGQKLPKCFLPLELEIQYLAKKGYTLIHIEDMKKVNSQQPIRPLSNSELKVFLMFQHSVGKILYFNQPNLDQHIIISPTFLIDAFKSIITDKHFCKGDKEKTEAWYSMDQKGIIFKIAVETIWKNKKYKHFFKFMGYLLGVMTHLDILVEPRRYDSHHHRIPTEFFYVASMVHKQDTTGYLQSPTFSHRNIAMSFDATSSIIPPALSFRFISYCLSIWGVKTYGDHNEDMLFHRSAVFTIDPSLDLHIQCEEERLIVRLVHARSRALIMRDLAASIQECLSAALHKISQLYIKTSSESPQYTRSFDVKVCCSSSTNPCSIAIEGIDDVWFCSQHQIEHGKDLVLSWFTKKGMDDCESSCPVTDENFLQQTPTDLHLRRLTLVYTMDEVRALVTELGLPCMERDELYNNISLTPETIKFTSLKRCSEKKTFTFKDFKIAAQKQDIPSIHKICKVVRDEHIRFDNEPEKWDLTVTDEDIDKLAPFVGNRSLGFLVELGLTFQDWEQVEYNQRERDLVKLNRMIMESWRTKFKAKSIKPALRTIGQAFGNIGLDSGIIEKCLFN